MARKVVAHAGMEEAQGEGNRILPSRNGKKEREEKGGLRTRARRTRMEKGRTRHQMLLKRDEGGKRLVTRWQWIHQRLLSPEITMAVEVRDKGGRKERREQTNGEKSTLKLINGRRGKERLALGERKTRRKKGRPPRRAS